MDIDTNNQVTHKKNSLKTSQLSTKQFENILQSYKEIIDHWYYKGLMLISKFQSGAIQGAEGFLKDEYNQCLNEIYFLILKPEDRPLNESCFCESKNYSFEAPNLVHTEILKQNINNSCDENLSTPLKVLKAVSKFIEFSVSFGLAEFSFLEKSAWLAIDMKNESNLKEIMRSNLSLIQRTLWIGKFSFSKMDSFTFEVLLDDVLEQIKSSNYPSRISADYICQQINRIYMQRNRNQLKRLTFERICRKFNINWKSKANEFGLRTFSLTNM